MRGCTSNLGKSKSSCSTDNYSCNSCMYGGVILLLYAGLFKDVGKYNKNNLRMCAQLTVYYDSVLVKIVFIMHLTFVSEIKKINLFLSRLIKG